MSVRKVCVVTGTRAEYGLLSGLLRRLRDDPRVELQLVVTGMHLSPEFGSTVNVIEADGFSVAARVDMLLSSNSSVGITKSVGIAVLGLADVFERLQPDVLVVLGDRFEILAAAQAAMFARIPLAHIHGGESTEGLVDEAIRHAITKMSQLHFVSAEPYRRRVIQMGEQPDRVWTVGAPGIDNIRQMTLLDRRALERELGFSLGSPTFLVTYHPVTLAAADAVRAIHALFAALDQFPDASVIFTKANADESGALLNAEIDAYATANASRVRAFTSLGQLRYLSAMAQCSVVIGNSSSGIIEAPALKRPTVNIGPRQRGRLRAPSVIDADENTEAIVLAVRQALSGDFVAGLPDMWSSYGDGNATERIAETLVTVSLQGILMKPFYDLDVV